MSGTNIAGTADAAEADAENLHEHDQLKGLLSAHVPISLIADLGETEGPDSAGILEAEGLPDDAWWITPDAEESGEQA